MGNDPSNINKMLYPVAWTYGAIVNLRNKLFDWGMLRSEKFKVPVICIGNLAVGGTGKTPHTEYIIRLLQNEFRVAVLSRGYKRRSKGFILADPSATAEKIGDEPYQMYAKFPNIQVAVDENRREGITRLMADRQKAPQVILLDDAFQHRYVKAGLNVLLTDYHRLFCDDALLPAGRLREPASGKDRAHIVVVTKCPKNLLPIQYTIIRKKLALKPYQKLFFSTLYYGELKPLFGKGNRKEDCCVNGRHILLVTGIANPAPLHDELKQQGANVQLSAFADHHTFSKKEVADIIAKLGSMPRGSILVTTEKDATRLIGRSDIPTRIQEKIYVMPIEIGILRERKSTFNKAIISYVRENQ